MLLLNNLDQVHEIEVNGQTVTFTVRPGSVVDFDKAFLQSDREINQLVQAADDAERDNLLGLKAGRYLLLQRITAWDGVYLSETEPAPCTFEVLIQFFGRFPGALMELSRLVREHDGEVEKN